jgi:ribose/xylose/arabinose/galactoside ABC-type transport system permease subunit
VRDRRAGALVLAVAAPGYFSTENLSDLFLANLPVLLVAIGMTLVSSPEEIDISVGSTFAICGVVAGVLAKGGRSGVDRLRRRLPAGRRSSAR